MTDKKTTKLLLTNARRELVAAVMEARKKIWTAEKLDYLLPYPVYRVDAAKRTAVFANAIQIKVHQGGRLSIKRLRPDVKPKLLKTPIDLLAREWAAEIRGEYLKQLNEAIIPRYLCPNGWETVRQLAEKVEELSGVEDRVAMLSWLQLRCPFSASRLAGIKNIDAVGRLFKIEVAKMIESNPDAAMVKNSFFWWRPVKILDPTAWNRLIKLTPIIKRLKAENKRLAVPYVTTHFWGWLNGLSKYPPDWIDVAPDKAISAWRASLIDRGLTQSAWRWITHLASPQLMALVANYSGRDPWDQMIPILNHVVARQLPANNFIKWMKLHWDGGLENPRMVALYEAVILHRHRHRKLFNLEEVGQQMRSIKDYLHWREGDIPDENILRAAGVEWPDAEYSREGSTLAIPKGASFQWFLRRSEAWHKKMEAVWAAQNQAWSIVREFENREYARANAIRTEARNRAVWDSALQPEQMGDFDVVPLTTGIALAEEGAEMRHCVSGYVDLCKSYNHRLFSIRKDGKRLATLEIAPVRHSNKWEVLQVRGKCNSAVDAQIAAVATLVANAYTKAVLQSAKKRA